MSVLTEMEFSVEMTCNSCANAVKSVIKGKPINILSLDVSKNLLHLESSLSWFEVQKIIESSGKRTALMGLGTGSQNNLGAGVAEISGNLVQGVVRMVQLNKDLCLFDGTIHGLTPGNHGIAVHEFGDLSQGCDSCGEHYNPYNYKHGNRTDKVRHLGDLGNIYADENGKASFKFTDNQLKIWDMIGRSFVVHKNQDDLGCGANIKSHKDGNAGPGIGCAIIARSAGLFQNAKRICTCDGVVVFDERNLPLVGKERKSKQKL